MHLLAFACLSLQLALALAAMALSSGHGPRVLGFQGGSSGVDFHVFQGGQQSAKKIVYTPQTNKNPLTIGKLFLHDFKRCQQSANKMVETSQKNALTIGQTFLHDFKRCHNSAKHIV